MSNNHNGVGTPPPERRVLSMFHSSRKGVMELNLEVCVLTFNPDLPAMLGYRPATLENIPLFDLIHAEDQEQSQVAFGDLIHGDTQSFDIVARLVTALGETLWCRMLVEPMCDAHGRLDRLIAVVLNLNDHRLEEDKLRTDQDRLSTFIAAGEEGIILTRDGIILDCNAQIAAIAGITVDDLIGHSVEEFVRAADRPRLRRLIEKGQFDRDEFEVVRPDGQVIYIEVFGQRSPKDRSGASFTIVRDITEHHQRRMEFDRLNRTLRALRESSLALVSATEEKAYLNKVCKVLVDQCGYSRVSIGLLAESDTVNYTTVAQWGLNHKKVLDSFDLGALTDEHGEGITSQAIRTNRPAVCQDIRADSSLPAWHKEQILSLGGMSAASIPLALQGAVFGTLTIFASRTNALPPAEVQLLQTLSDDLAFGIQTLRSREARVKAEHDLAEKTKELEALFNTIPATVYVTDSDHRLFKANTRFQKEFKLDPDQLLGKRHSDFLPLDLAQQCKESSRLAIEQGSVSDLEETSIDENGRQRWWATAKTALFDEKNGLTRIVGVSIEITDRKLAERERYSRLKHQKDELEILSNVVYERIRQRPCLIDQPPALHPGTRRY